MADQFFNRFVAEVAAARREPGRMGPPRPSRPCTQPGLGQPPGSPARVSMLAMLPREPLGLPMVAWIGGVICFCILILIFWPISDGRPRRLPLPRSPRPRRCSSGAATSPTASSPPPSTWRSSMRRPLFLEGEPGTGKTEIAKVLAAGLGRRLVRLQCYDGIDLSAAAYEWDHARQLMAIRLAEAAGETDRELLAGDIYTREFLQERPLLSAIDPVAAARRAADRRARPRRRAVRGLPARGAGRFPDLGPGIRHDPRRRPRRRW